MTLAERLLIAPSALDLERAIAAGFVQAQGAVAFDPPTWSDTFADIHEHLDVAESGDRYWDGITLAENERLSLRLIWVRDYIGRVSVRLQFVRRRFTAEGDVVWPRPETDRTPAELLYTRHAFRFRREPDAEPVVLLGCACGVLGTADEIAWMGERCGPCHDRAEAGEPLPEPCGRHERTPRNPANDKLVGRTLAVTPDGDHAVVIATRDGLPEQEELYRLVLWDLDEQQARLRWRTGTSHVGVHLSGDGGSLGLIYPSTGNIRLEVFDWPGPGRGEAAAPRAEAVLNGGARCFTLAPDGSLAYIGDGGRIDVVDLLATPPVVGTILQLEDEALDLACTPDGRWLAIYWRERGMVLIDRGTSRLEAVAPMRQQGLIGIVTVSPDSRTLFACDDLGQVTFFEMPTLNRIGMFQTDHRTIHGLDVCGPWLMLSDQGPAPIDCWPWELLVEAAQRVTAC